MVSQKYIESKGFKFLPKESLGDLTHRYEWKGYNERIIESVSYRYWSLYIRTHPDLGTLVVEADVSDGEREKFFDGVVATEEDFDHVLRMLNIAQ